MPRPPEDRNGPRIIVEEAGYQRSRLPNGIFVLRVSDARPATLQAWFEDCNKLMSRWQAEQPLRYIHDIRGAEQLTPHGIDYVSQVLRRMRYIPVNDGRGAIVLNNTTIATMLAPFFKRRPTANWQVRFFRDDQEAVRWLLQ